MMEALPQGFESNMDITFNLIDTLVAIIIIALYSAQRFNTWPAPSNHSGDIKTVFSDQPSDYINIKRFLIFYLIYALSVCILMLVFYGIPELLQIHAVSTVLKSVGIPEDNRTFVIFSLIAIAVLKIPIIAENEIKWRRQLHQWARIPREVDDLKKVLMRADEFTPTEDYIKQARQNIKKRGLSLQPRFKQMEIAWLEYLNDFQKEKENNTVYWKFLHCLILFIMAKEICSSRILGSIKDTEEDIFSLGSKITSTIESNPTDVKELDTMSNHFVECICKQVVKIHPDSEERLRMLKNLGFGISHQDCVEPKYGQAFLLCSFGVAFASLFSVAAILQVLSRLDKDRLLTWTLGSFLSLCIAIFVAFIIYTQLKHKRAIDTISAQLVCLFVSTLASALYFIIVPELNARSTGNPLARIVLAMSFATLSPFVYRAIEQTKFSTENNFRTDKIRRFAIAQGVMLGVIMMVFQCLVSVSFQLKPENPHALTNFLSIEKTKLAFLATIGFTKGFFLAAYTTYLIQITKRIYLISCLRAQPRAKEELPLPLSSENAPAWALDISKNGLRIETDSNIQAGDFIELESVATGKISGQVKWINRISGGKTVAGVFLSQNYPVLHNYLRKRYGDSYA